MTREKFDCLRVWPEWESSGIWAPGNSESLRVGPMVDYDQLDLPSELAARFEAWQVSFDVMDPSRDND